MGFAAEIKEFLGAAKDSWKLMSDTESKDADAKYKNTLAAKTQADIDNPLNDEEQKAKIANLKARTANVGSGNALRDQYYKLLIDAQKNPQETGPATVAAPPVMRPAIGAPPKTDPNADDSGTGFNKGGLVRKFADGGMIDDSDLEDDEGDGGALPTQAIPTAGAGYPSPSATPTAPRPAVGGVPLPTPRPPNPVDDALKYGVTQLPPPQAVGMPGGARTRALRGFAQGAGAAPPEDMVKIYRKIDPKGEMGESERNMYAMQAVWQYKMNQNDPKGAAEAAFQMLQHYKVAATRYAALTKAAMDGGDVNEGIKLALKAYAQVPDGNNMKLYKGKDGHIGYEMTDKDGKQISGGIATPAEIGAAAMKLATPGGFENHLVQMTSGAKLDSKGGVSIGGPGGKAKATDDEEDTGPAKPKDYAATQEQVGQHVENWVTAQQKANPNKKFEPNEIAAVKNAMYHIRRNNDITDDEALNAARTYMTAPEAGKGQKAPFKVTKDQDAGEATIRYPDGRELKMPMNDYLPLAALRGKALDEQDKAKKAADAKANEGPGYASQAATAVGDYVSQDLAKTKKQISDLADQNPELVASVQSAAGVGKQTALDAIEWTRKNLKSLPSIPSSPEKLLQDVVTKGIGAVARNRPAIDGAAKSASSSPPAFNPDDTVQP